MRAIVTLLMVTALGLGACSSKPKEAAADKEKQFRYLVHVGPGGVLYSPNGEPLNGGPLGNPTCTESMTRWFGLVDTNHDGVIDQTEFSNDARMQFNRMDRDHDSAIYPSELLSYREPFQIGIKRKVQVETTEDKNAKNKAIEQADVSDPVMSADTNLDFKVTLDELTAQAQDLFKVIDHDHDGKIEKAEMLGTCPVETDK